jgi:acetyl esterase
MTLDPETQAFVAQLAATATKPRHLLTPAEARAAFAGLRAMLDHGGTVARETDLTVPVAGGTLPARLFVPNGAPSALLVYFHGGGWVVGTLAEFSPLCRDIARASGMAVALVEYRKAPEHRFPGPVDDAWAATQWFAREGPALLGGALKLLVGGDSAGGNLAMVVTLRARRAGAPALAGQLLIYPVADCRFDRESYLDPANQLMTTIDTMKAYWSHYVPDPAMRLFPEASPLRAPDLAGLPPAIVITAEHDVLRDEGEEYARRLDAAGVRVQQRRFDGQMHGFAMMLGILPGARLALDYIGAALRALIGPSASKPSTIGGDGP